MGGWYAVGPCIRRCVVFNLTTLDVPSCRLTAQLVGPKTKELFNDGPRLQDLDLVVGPGRSQFASFTWADLAAVAPWLELTKHIDGPGLGN